MIAGSLTAALKTTTAVEANKDQLTKLKKACDGMESSFVRQLLSEMRKTVSETKTGGDDTGADTYRGMFDDALSDRLAARGTLGISKTVFHAMAGQVLNAKVANKS